MAKFNKVMEERMRMCKTIRDSGDCFDCPLQEANKAENYSYHTCFWYFCERYNKASKLVMQWAAENPEPVKPVYPTWMQWLIEQGVISSKSTRERIGGINANIIIFNKKAYEPIPAELAQKMGIEPKECV